MKNILRAVVFVDADVAATQTSRPFSLGWLNGAGFQAVFTEGTGTLEVQTSYDCTLNADGSVRDSGHWDTVPDLTVSIVSGLDPDNNPSVTLDTLQNDAPFVRLLWTSEDDEAVGTINASMMAKSL